MRLFTVVNSYIFLMLILVSYTVVVVVLLADRFTVYKDLNSNFVVKLLVQLLG